MSRFSTMSSNVAFGSLPKGNGVSIHNESSGVKVEVDLPGFNKNDIKFSGSNGYLLITARNKDLETASLQVLVGNDAIISSARASVKDGKLTISLAKRNKDKSLDF